MDPTPPPQNPGQAQSGGNPPGPYQAAAGGPPPPGGGYPQPGPGYPPPQGGQGGYPPPPGGYPGYHPYPGQSGLPAPGSGGTSTPAIIGFILSIFGIVLFSIILCIVALSQIPKRGQRGKGLAIAGLIISGLWVVIGGLLVIGLISTYNDNEPKRDASGQVTTTVDTKPNKLRVGDCVTGIEEGVVKDIKVQPCDQPNGGKVFAVFELPAGEWPGLAAVQAAAEKGCTDRFKALKQTPDKPSDVFFLHPIENGWTLGDRNATCLLVPE
ncbi:DUF4190 domain-containing protein [Kribbella ginsengisoli]|uniref:DUF4190 domain-containing protein n=1 Tax=Kribbella ginsengisoli TaxID=363865 RepID=A0ABP6XIV4_9ACTN